MLRYVIDCQEHVTLCGGLSGACYVMWLTGRSMLRYVVDCQEHVTLCGGLSGTCYVI